MSSRPYPGFPPSYKAVDQLGGYHRTCLVVELLSLTALTTAQLAYIKEQLEATLARLPLLEKSEVAGPSQFDVLLRAGLRLVSDK